MRKVKYSVYDIDDNLFFLPTKIIFFKKDENVAGPKEIFISTENFAKTRKLVGVADHKIFLTHHNGEVHGHYDVVSDETVNLLDYHTLSDDGSEFNSFRQFRDHATENYLINNLKEGLANKAFGPSFNDLVEDCKTLEGSKRVYFATARGQSPKTIHAAFVFLQQQGQLNFVPPVEHFFPVSYKGLDKKYVGDETNPSLAKLNVICSILDDIELTAKKYRSKNQCEFHFGFSDDDKATYELVAKEVENNVKQKRWKKVHISLYFTGHKDKRTNKVHTPVSAAVKV